MKLKNFIRCNYARHKQAILLPSLSNQLIVQKFMQSGKYWKKEDIRKYLPRPRLMERGMVTRFIAARSGAIYLNGRV